MANLLEFTGVILLLLLTPGPTNTLMALGGYSRGIVRALPLILGELCGYLAVIVPVAVLAAPYLAAHPGFSLAAKVAACLWVLFLACRLWFRQEAEGKAREVTVVDIMVTTMLNPKALIIAVVVMPSGTFSELLPWLSLFSGLVVFAACGWITLGCSLSKGKSIALTPQAIQKIAATFLLLFAAILATSTLRALA